MGVMGCWCFYRVEENHFLNVRAEFERASVGIGDLPEVLCSASLQEVTPTASEGNDPFLEDIISGRDLSEIVYHEPFQDFADRLSEDENLLGFENCIETVVQPRTLPSVILLAGIGADKFSRLPGYFGNLLLHPSEIENAITTIDEILEVDWDTYFERSKSVLHNRVSDDIVAKDVLEVLHIFPQALRKVRDEKSGLLSLVFWA